MRRCGDAFAYADTNPIKPIIPPAYPPGRWAVVRLPPDCTRFRYPTPASGLGEAGFGPEWLPGIGPAPIQERCPQIPVFQAYGTVSKIESFRGDCKDRIEDFGGNRRIIKSQGKICVPWKSLIVRKIIKIAHPKKDRPFKANDYKSAIYMARLKAVTRIKPRNTRQRAPYFSNSKIFSINLHFL